MLCHTQLCTGAPLLLWGSKRLPQAIDQCHHSTPRSVQSIVLAAVVLVAVVLALGVRHLLHLADQTAQAKWGNPQQQEL